MRKCKSADKYKGKLPPKCGGKEGPCDVCQAIFDRIKKINEKRKEEASP